LQGEPIVKRSSTWIARFVAVLAMSAAGAARAGVVTYAVSGTVDGFTDTSGANYVPASVQPNVSSFVGTFSFDNTAPGSVNGGDAVYKGTALSLTADVTIDGRYRYTLTAPTAQDEIDISGTSFELFKRGPTVTTGFSPNPPFSHFEFEGTTQTDILSTVVLGNVASSAGVSDQQTSTSPYWYIGANVSSVQPAPEPSSVTLLAVAAGSLLAGAWKRRRNGMRKAAQS